MIIIQQPKRGLSAATTPHLGALGHTAAWLKSWAPVWLLWSPPFPVLLVFFLREETLSLQPVSVTSSEQELSGLHCKECHNGEDHQDLIL